MKGIPSEVQNLRILHLTLKRERFVEIAYGRKRCDYRLATPYWIPRLLNRTYDEVHFRNGYRPDSPFMRVDYDNTFVLKKHGVYIFAIILGDVMEIKNINLPS